VALVALRGRSRWSRVTVLVLVGVGLAFAVHAASVAPTNGVLFIDPNNPSAYIPHTATSGAGETVAIAGLGLAALGLLLSLAVDLSSKRVRSTR
jgi:MFS-type transporter involved in bile tolerance (Atg22 family)